MTPPKVVGRHSFGPFLLLFSLLVSRCGGNSLTVGGTVSGLKGKLELELNDEGALEITENGDYVFGVSLVSGNEYEVTVVSTPPDQSCLLENGSGVLNGASVTDANVVCTDKQWNDPTDLSDNISPAGQNALYPQVAMDSRGDTIVVWQQSDGSHTQIFKAEYRNGSWDLPTGLSDHISLGGQAASNPAVAMDNDGNAIIAWQQSDGTDEQIYIAEYRGGSWTMPTISSDNISPDGKSASSPQVAADDNGNMIVVWRQRDSVDEFQIFKAEYRSGSWTLPVDLSDNISPDGDGALKPDVAMDNNGNAIIVWQQLTGAVVEIFKAEYRSGMWTLPADLSDNISPAGSSGKDAVVAMDDDENAIVVWSQSDGSFNQVFKAEYRSGVWTVPSSLSDNISPNGQGIKFPKVSMDDNGNAVVVWSQLDGTNDQIFTSEYRDGAWDHPNGLSDNISPDSKDALNVQVAMDNLGNAVIVWQQFDDELQIFRSEYRNGSWVHPTGLTDNISPAGQNAQVPQVAAVKGKAAIVWQQGDSTAKDAIFVSEYR